jgi:protein TonB
MAQSARIEGVVILEATVGERGRVTDVRALRSHPILETAAMRAVERWRYEPLVVNGEPTPFVLIVTVSFTPGRSLTAPRQNSRWGAVIASQTV